MDGDIFMMDQNVFMETLREVAEIIRTSEVPLSETEMLSYFSDMDLSEEQKTLVLQYLTTSVNEMEEIDSEEPEGLEKPAALQIYLDELAELPAYTKEEGNNMYQALLAGDDKVISNILELWLSKVTEFAKAYVQEKILVEDLIQEGNMALFMKLTQLCGSKREDFTETELETAIETGIMQYASKLAGELELENALRGKISLVHEAAKILKEESGHEPTFEELAAYTRLSKEELEAVMDVIAGVGETKQS